MENLEELIQFTFTSSFKRGSVNAFADFLGYKEEIADSPTTFIPNPLSKVDYVAHWTKELFVNKMAEMNIAQAKAAAVDTFNSSIAQIEQTVKSEVESGIAVQTQIL